MASVSKTLFVALRPYPTTLPVALGSILLGCGPSLEAPGDSSDTGVPWPAASDTEDTGEHEHAETQEIPDAGGTGDLDCGHQVFPLTAERPQVVLLLDKSHTMVDAWDHDHDPATPEVTRWYSLYHVVRALAQSATDSLDLGVVLFPSRTLSSNDLPAACTVEPVPAIAVGSFGAEVVAQALPGPEDVELFGGTATSRGLEVALEHLEQIDEGRAQAIVLITDGAANCMEGTTGHEAFDRLDENLEPMVAQAFAAGIPTYVVGVDIEDEWREWPQANPYQSLGAIAQAGGVPQPGDEPFYNTRDQDELLEVLDHITGRHSCRFALEVPPEWDDQLRVLVDGDEFPRVPTCDAGTGWRYVDDAPHEAIELCDATCDVASARAELEVEYACRPVR